jgi:hypothetical protein
MTNRILQGIIYVPLPVHYGIFNLGESEQIHLNVGDEAKTIEIPYKELYIGEVEDMADAVLERKESRTSLTDSRVIIDMIVGLFESAWTGRVITL